jgi:hypothetical protein
MPNFAINNLASFQNQEYQSALCKIMATLAFLKMWFPRARRIMLTHMNPTMLAHLNEIRSAGVEAAEDGDVVEL